MAWRAGEEEEEEAAVEEHAEGVLGEEGAEEEEAFEEEDGQLDEAQEQVLIQLQTLQEELEKVRGRGCSAHARNVWVRVRVGVR